MVPGRASLFLFAAVVGLAMAGCSSAPKQTPKGKTVIPAQASSDRVVASVHLYDEVVIQLPLIIVPGNRWTIVFNDERFLVQRRPIETGPAGQASVTFFAVRQGQRLVRFFALPPDTREATPTQAYEVDIHIE